MCTHHQATLAIGDTVRYANSDEWRVSETPATKPDHIVLTHDLVRQQLLPEFLELNPGCEPVKDQPYKVRRTNLAVEDGWVFIGYQGTTTLHFHKIGGLVKEVPLADVEPVGVRTGPGELERFLTMRRQDLAPACGRRCQTGCRRGDCRHRS